MQAAAAHVETQLRKKMRAYDSATTTVAPLAPSATGACSLDDPHPKFWPPMMTGYSVFMLSTCGCGVPLPVCVCAVAQAAQRPAECQSHKRRQARMRPAGCRQRRTST